jgi:hypothetical protein
MGCTKTSKRISEDERQQILADRDAKRREALEKLSEAGIVMAAQSEAYKVHIVVDRIDCDFGDHGLQFVIDGTDISDMVQKLGVSYTNDIPVFSVMLKPIIKPWKKG